MSVGCGSGYRVWDPPVTVSAAQQQKIASVTNFGDSITCGGGASPDDPTGHNLPSVNGYASLLDTAIDRPSMNLCVRGQQAADMTSTQVYPNAIPMLGASQLYTVLIGINDANACGGTAGCLANWNLSLSASLAWLALPAGDKALAANSTHLSGGWTQDLGIGMSTTAEGASLSLPVQQAVANRPVYVAYRVFDPATKSGGTADVLVDGVAQGQLSANPATGHVILPQNGGSGGTIFLAQFPLGAVGAHTLTVVTSSANGAFFSVLWAGASTANYSAVPGAPRVIVGEVTNTTQNYLNEYIVNYNAQLHSIVAALASDGLNIQIAPTSAALIPLLDYSDSLHPNNDGHARLAIAFASVL